MAVSRSIDRWLFSLGLKPEPKNRAGIEALIRSLRPETPSVPLIRCGGAGDGGYLVPDDFAGLAACISPGVAGECSFDLDMAKRGFDVYMADASVNAPPIAHEKFHFSKLFIDTYSSDCNIRLDDFCGGIGDKGDLLLQMDIEGAEYRVLSSISDRLLERFRIIVLEMHYLDALFTNFGFMEISSVFKRLLRTHAIVHLHPNNVAPVVRIGSIAVPRVLEVTLLRRDRSRFTNSPTLHPHPLDRPNVPNKEDIVLPPHWHY